MKRTLIKFYRLLRDKIRLFGRFEVTNRSKSSKYLCIVLAGYKPELWKDVFARLNEYYPEEWDLCVLSAGKSSGQLAEICKRYQWSYLNTKRNNLSLIQNIAINYFKDAKYIFKIDEDVFVTKNSFSELITGLKAEQQSDEYFPGYVAPVINVNNFSYLNLLKYYELNGKFKNKSIKLADLRKSIQFNNIPEAAEFMWAELPSIDSIDSDLKNKPIANQAIPTRFNIGMILFERKLWSQMHMFKIGYKNAMGLDEEQIDNFCMMSNQPAIMIGSTCVGHLGFGAQSKLMKEYYSNNREKFCLNINNN